MRQNKTVNGLVKNAGDSYHIHLNGHLLTVGSGGINSIGTGQLFITNGRITSSGRELLISSSSPHMDQLDIDAVICDAPTHKVGLVIRGSKAYRLLGATANTFTGDVEIIGAGQYFALAKADGVAAVLGDIYIKNGAMLGIDSSNQISDSSIVTLSGNRSIFGLFNTGRPLTESFYRLAVKSFYDGVLFFGHNKNESFQKSLFLDELEIGIAASLSIEGWQKGRDHLFVKKTSRNLRNTLTKVHLKGYLGYVGVRDYNKDYWEIGIGAGFRPLPEPTTYGAAFSVAALGLWVLWAYRRKRCTENLARENASQPHRRLLPTP